MDTRHLRILIEKKIKHTYLEKHIQKPVIDEEKLILLTAVIKNTTLSATQKEHYIITTMLVQIALDTHDLVPEVNYPDENAEVKLPKQLNVLAGDYFSGLYYLLLSEIEDFDLIHKLASAIKEINEYKMKLYYKEADSFQDYIDLIKEVESLLIRYVGEYVNDSIVSSITYNWLITNKLIHERNKFGKYGFSSLLAEWINNSSSTDDSILDIVESIINTNLIQLDEMLLQLPLQHQTLKEHINSSLHELLLKKTSIVEEG
ncbi:heptaprenyl diphosphate synthase component 1 [Virgibacillus sp. C22-A2]|uniref:Heptaprenyl diphosphate synthase component 1 n=2 Tax=Virgibacillus tibetensis TaxID=3042313 RepID=A0ABU6KC16_9BACI|nr:heptaprenyl diphosphate synthase component 1 [Virgibacillus sp. C22-A2]